MLQDLQSKQWRSRGGASGGVQSWALALVTHQHTLQSLKKIFLS